MTVEEMLRRMSSAEISEWAAWNKLREWEGERDGSRRADRATRGPQTIETIGGPQTWQPEG